MVTEQLRRRGILDAAVLDAMALVPRHEFVASELTAYAYSDAPLPIGSGQTISQPYVVALMAESLQLSSEDRVLEIGAGSGYAAAVLSRIAREVFTIERHPELAAEAAERLERLGYDNVHVRCGDGSIGWLEAAPFDAIAVAAGSPGVPRALVEQLALGGRLLIPVGRNQEHQELLRVSRTERGIEAQSLGPVRFVPLVGAQGWERADEDGGAPVGDPSADPFLR